MKVKTTPVSALIDAVHAAGIKLEVKGPRYALLGDWLNRHGGSEAELTFRDIETIVGGDLPASARKGRSFWGNDRTHSHAKCWLSRGFMVASVSLQDETVSFRWDRRLARMNSHNALHDYVALFGPVAAPRLTPAEAMRSVSTLQRDRATFEAMTEGLRRAGSAKIVFYARVHEPPQRGRRTEHGYGTILVYERDRPTAPMQMLFADGMVGVACTLGDKQLRRISMWPTARQLAGLQFTGLWQSSSRYLVAWPDDDSRRGDELELAGVFVVNRSITPTECLRVYRWLLREADTFEDGLRKLLTRKRALSPVRALELADKHLARYVCPPTQLASLRNRPWPIDRFLLMGCDEAPKDSREASVAVSPPAKGADPCDWALLTSCRRLIEVERMRRSPEAAYGPLRPSS